MRKNTAVFLFGAGAAIDWNGPTTQQLTDAVLNSGFSIRGEEKKITRFIYEKLLDNGYEERNLNFETIINVIEELIIFYSNFNYADHYSKKVPALIKCFTTPLYEDALLNFSIRGNGKEEHGFKLDIPTGIQYDYSRSAVNDETSKQAFFQHLLVDLLTTVAAKVSKYAYHSPGSSCIDMKGEPSLEFCKWMKNLSTNSTLRFYTLNYDRLFKVLLCNCGISVFEGFDCEEHVTYGDPLRANVRKIIQDEDSHVHYNLHGSIFWRVLDLDREQLPNAEIVLTGFPELPINDEPATFQMERGKTITLTNIITGYQKAQKSLFTPIKQMQYSFDRDCCFADTLFVVGYSFGDEHINESIKTALRHNGKIKIVIVDPSFVKSNLDEHVALNFFPYKDGANGPDPKNISKNIYSYIGGTVMAYQMTFTEFLRFMNDPMKRWTHETPISI